MKIYNHKIQKSFRQQLRNRATEPELRIWQRVKSCQLGFKFRRQHGIGPYVVDFYVPQKKIVIEIDGDSHFDETARLTDHLRDKYLRQHGHKVLRFTNLQVMQELDGVMQCVLDELQSQ